MRCGWEGLRRRFRSAGHLLGETWCDDPAGLIGSSAAPVERPARTGGGPLGDQVADRLRRVLAEAAARPRPGVGTDWLSLLTDLLADDPRARPMLDELTALAADRCPRVLLYGDYNVGKSSFIKRLLVDDGQTAPENLTVRGAPETAAVHSFDWLGLRLIDTPGLQSGVTGHSELAQAQLPDAALVVYMLGATGVVGDRAGLDRVLRGDPEHGIVPKLDRTIFVVNRADELEHQPVRRRGCLRPGPAAQGERAPRRAGDDRRPSGRRCSGRTDPVRRQ